MGFISGIELSSRIRQFGEKLATAKPSLLGKHLRRPFRASGDHSVMANPAGARANRARPQEAGGLRVAMPGADEGPSAESWQKSQRVYQRPNINTTKR